MKYQNKDIMATFTAGQSYGNDLTIKVISRTAKTVTIETTAWGTSRVKIREFQKGHESIVFKAWSIGAEEQFNPTVAAQNSMYNAYFL